ncbi:MAG: crotonase/enoyl-CoA hydratase family protein [Chloroflexota bacterium]
MAPSKIKDVGLRLPWHVNVAPVQKWIASMEERGQGEDAWERVAAWDRMVNDHGVVKVSTEGRVGIIELSYPPKANALVPPMYVMLVDAVERLGADDAIWTIVITGSGKTFSSGGYVGKDAFYAGLDAGHDGTKGEPIRRTLVEMFQKVPLAIYNCEKPTIAAVNGPVMAESLDIALSADLRTGSPDTQFRFSYAATGNTTYTGAAWTLPRLIGMAKAKEYLFTADWVDGTRAHESGLLTYLHEPDRLREETLKLAARIADLPPITLRLIKKEMHLGAAIGDLPSALDMYSMIEPIVQSTEDHMDAENAVIEKRAPVVRGR